MWITLLYMATGRTYEEFLKCSICWGQLINPRKLPGCFHTFCENCILTYITNIKSNDVNVLELRCPNCRRVALLPQSTDELNNWVKSLEGNTDMAANPNTESDHVEEDFCNSCKEVDKTIPAEKHCIDCHENLCTNCSRIRHGTKALKNHLMVDLGLSLADSAGNENSENMIQRLSNYLKCSKHSDRDITHVCKDDNFLCCAECVIDFHRHCNTIVDLKNDEIKEENKTKIKQIKSNVNKISSQIKVLTDFKQSNVEQNKVMADAITIKIRNIRAKVNTVFDALEENVCSQSKAFTKKFTLEADAEIEKLNEMNKEVTDCACLIDYAETLCSVRQMFCIVSELELKLDEVEKTILKEEESFSSYDLGLKTEQNLQRLIELGPNDTDQLARVTEVRSKDCFLEKRELLLLKALKYAGEHKILPENRHVISPKYYGITYVSDKHGWFLADNYHGYCCITDENCKEVKCFEMEILSGKPYSVTTLKTSVIAVSIPESKKIIFISDQNKSKALRVSGNIRTNFTPKSLSGLKNGEIAVSWDNPVAFGILQFTCSLYLNCYSHKVYFDHDTEGQKLKRLISWQ